MSTNAWNLLETVLTLPSFHTLGHKVVTVSCRVLSQGPPQNYLDLVGGWDGRGDWGF